MKSVAFLSSIFSSELPTHYQGSHLSEEPLDIMYSMSKAALNYKIIYIANNDHNTSLTNVDAVVLSTTNSYLQWNNHPLTDVFVQERLKFIKQHLNPLSKVPIFVFGPHVPTYFAELYQSGATAVFLGEAELAIVDALHAYFNGTTFSSIKGYINSVGEITEGPAVISELDMLPCPDYSSSIIHKFTAHNAPFYYQYGHLYETSRGCSFKCSYCNTVTHRRKYRVKSSDKIRTDLSKLSDITDRQFIYFIDESWGFDENWWPEILEVLSEFKFVYGCQTNLYSMTPKKAKMMAQAGFKSIEFGFESANESLLRTNGKINNDVETILTSLQVLSNNGVSPLLFVLVGLPGETEDTLNETAELLKRIPEFTRISVALPTPYLGTKLYKLGLKEGIINNEDKGYKLYDYCGRIGTSLKLTQSRSLLDNYRNKYGPNNFLQPDFITHWIQDTKKIFQLI